MPNRVRTSGVPGWVAFPAMSDDLTMPLGTVEPPGPGPVGPQGEARSGTDVCPNGHVLGVDQVIIRDGHKVCPVCEQQAHVWTPPPAPRPPVYWSRKSLRFPLALIAAAFLAEAVSSLLGIASAASYVSNHLTGASSTLASSIFDTVCQLGLSGAAAWLAYLVGLDNEPPKTP